MLKDCRYCLQFSSYFAVYQCQNYRKTKPGTQTSGSRSQDNADFGHFTLLICRGQQKSVSRIITHMQPFIVLLIKITAQIHARSLANFYCQYADRHMNLKFMRRVSERERAIRQFVIVKNKWMSVFYASVLLLTMNFVITLSKYM